VCNWNFIILKPKKEERNMSSGEEQTLLLEDELLLQVFHSLSLSLGADSSPLYICIYNRLLNVMELVSGFFLFFFFQIKIEFKE
jgi:hypothetical protein